MSPSDILSAAKLLVMAYSDMKDIIALLKDRLGDNWAKIISDTGTAARILKDPNATPDQLREGARQFSALFERGTTQS